MQHFLLTILALLFYHNVDAQTLDFVWSKYDTSKTIDSKSFTTLTKLEIDFGKSFDDFKNHRARLTLTDSGNQISPKELRMPNFPLPCKCVMHSDTIYITTALGLMSGLGIITAIHNDNFATTFFHYADNEKIFKTKGSDTAYVDNISVSTVYQRLTLFKKPTFANNEIITGTFNGQFKSFYELDSYAEPPLKRNYKAKLFFKCKLYAVTN